MLTLCGFAASNYYNKVKLALLEKGVPFNEELAWVGETDAAATPLGKVPYIKTDKGSLCESGVIMEYIEQQYPQNPLLPADPFAAAKVRELVTFLELHLELVARELHARGPRRERPFASVSCAGLPEAALEHELALQRELAEGVMAGGLEHGGKFFRGGGEQRR